MECDDDPNSILSLPQHTLLQSENGMSSFSLSTSSSSPTQKSLDKKQWPQVSYTQGSISGTATSISNPNSTPFSSVHSSSSLTHSYVITLPGSSNSSTQSHQLLPNSSSSKYYGHTSISNLVPQAMPYSSSSRTEHRFAVSPTNISEGVGGGTRSSNVASVSGEFELNTTLLSANGSNISVGDSVNNDSNKNDNNNDGGINQYYQTSYRNNGSNSMNLYSSRLLDGNNSNIGNSSNSSFVHSNRGSHHLDTGQMANPAILSLTNYQHGSNSEVDGSDDKMTKSQSSSRNQVHPNAGDVMEYSQSAFDARSKHLVSSKGHTDIYHGGSSTKTSAALLSHELVTSIEKHQQQDLTEFDLISLSARVFGPIGSSSSSNTRMDYILHDRSVDEEFRLNQDQSGDFLNQDLSHHKYLAPSSQSQSCNTAVNVRKVSSSMHSGFSSNQNIDQNIYSALSKSINTGSTYVHKDQISALRSSDGHKFSRDYNKKLQSQTEEIQQSSAVENNGSSEETWSNRSRAHRKMARLLGQASSCVEKPEKTQQEHSTSSLPSYQPFVKKAPNLAGYGGTFQEMPKSHEDSKKYLLPETNRDPPSTSNVHIVKNIDRLGNSAEISVSYDRRDEDVSRNMIMTSVRDYNNFATLGASNPSGSLVLREASSSLVPSTSQHLFPTTAAGFDLEFQPSVAQRELDPQFVLQVSKDLGMEENLADNVNANPELFSHQVDPQHIAPTNFPFTDNLGSQYTQDILLDSYLNPTEKDGSSFNKKIPYYNQRNLTSEAEFNIEEYMEGQVDKEFTQAYFDRTDNVPQDMTMYQKVSPEKSTPSSYTKFKERESTSSQNLKTGTTKQNESNNICELQKELTKTSGKESMKGVRTPRDINRAMEILHLQETEKEEENKRKRELEKQLNNETHTHQPQQQQHQKFQQSATTINSSPKKTFQNKHQIESMAALTEQLLPIPSNFIEDHAAENVSFLDQPSYCFPDQSTTASSGFCDQNIQEMSQYSGFPSLYQPGTADLDVTALSNKQRDYQQQNTSYPLNQELDYHILKRLAFSTANAKDLDTINMSSLQPTSSNMTPWLPNTSTQQTDTADLNFNLGIPRLPEPLGLLNEGPVPSTSNKFPSNSSTNEDIRGGQIQSQCDNLNYSDITPEQRAVCLDPDKFQNFSSSFGDGGSTLPTMDIVLDKAMALDILEASRENLYNMMKHEQLCDAVLSTSNFEVKVHQIILCSMSQYLSSLLLPSTQSSTELKSNPSSSSTFPQSSKSKEGNYSSNTNTYSHSRHHLVMFIVNCDNIKSASISAFLMFIYLGKTEFSESNVLDLFILASSLHVSTLKNLCLQFMWQAHISDDGLNIPSVQISKKDVVEMRDQTCFANLGNKKSTVDKAVHANRVIENTDVASQTDQTTCKVGRGGQDEWVMLKKTKQKTVSPSKSKINQSVKGINLQDSNQPAFKPVKKSWLSPKRRFKSELLAQAKNDQNNLTKIKDKEVTASSDSQKVDEMNLLESKELTPHSGKFVSSDRNFPVSKRPQMIHPLQRREEEENEEATAVYKNLRHIKTTVEIAEEAAAAKLTASNANVDRGMKKGTISLISSSSGIGHDPYSQKTTKDHLQDNEDAAVYSQPEMNSVLGKARQNNSCKRDAESCKQAALDMNMPPQSISSASTIERPVKKKIIQQSINTSNNEMDMTALDVPNNISPKKSELCNPSKTHSNEKSSIISTVPTFTQSSVDNMNLPNANEGDLNHVSCFFDSIVNKMGSGTDDAELQKVIHDLDSELNRPQISALPVVSSSFVTVVPSSLSLLSTSNVMGSSSISSSFSPCVSTMAKLTTTAVSSSSIISSSSSSSPLPPLSSVSKSKSAAQGYRKRLIQLVKSENLKLSSSSSSLSLTSLPHTSSVANVKDVENEMSMGESQSQGETLPVPAESESAASLSNESKRREILDEGEESLSQNQTDCKKGTEEEANNSASEKGGKGGTTAEDYDTQFHHKIFKRKRKLKTRKTTSSEADNFTPCPKLKTKRASIVSEGEGNSNTTKTRVRKNTATASDTETSVTTTATRSKGKKVPTIESAEEGDGAIRNVRPPPKKRAKMELELLKVTSEDGVSCVTEAVKKKDQHTACGTESFSASEDGAKPDSDNVIEKERLLVDLNVSVGREEVVDTIVKESQSVVNGMDTSETCFHPVETMGHKRGKAHEVVKPKPTAISTKKRKPANATSTDKSKGNKSPKPNEEENHVSLAVVSTQFPDTHKSKDLLEKASTSSPSSVESQYAKELLKRFKLSGLTERIFSCRLCKLHIKSPLVSVKHAVSVHKLEGDDILQNVVVGFAENRHEACDICGYVTKDVTYKYMHYHKYFKHNVPLPSGLTTQKCHLCSREFQTSYQLNEHVKGHDDDFCFTCWVCGQSFKSRNNMNNHVFHKHSKQRKHCCKICDKAFKTWTHLKVHVRVHTGDRPFTCTECGYGSTTLGNMRHHLTHKHKMGKGLMEEAMVKISERKTEMTPKQLDHLMDLIVSKEMPDQAYKTTEKQKGKNKSRKATGAGKNDNKSSGEDNKSDSMKEILRLKLASDSKSALKEKIPSTVSTTNVATFDLGGGQNSMGKLLLPKIEHSNNETTCLSSFPPSSLIQHQYQQKSLTVISQPIMANNILIIPSGPAGKQMSLSDVIQTTTNNNLNASEFVTGPSSSSNVDSNSVLGSVSIPVVSNQGSQLSADIPHQETKEGEPSVTSSENKQIFIIDSSTVANSTSDCQQSADNIGNAALIQQQDANNSSATGESNDLRVTSLHTALPTLEGSGVLSIATAQQQQDNQVVSTNNITMTSPAALISNSNSNDTLIDNSQSSLTGTTSLPPPPPSPSSSLLSSSTTSSSAPTSCTLTVLPSSQPLQQFNQCDGSSGSVSSTANAISASNFIYAAGPPIMLQNPVIGAAPSTTGSVGSTVDINGSGATTTTMLQGLLPSFIMYPCQPNSNGQQPLMQLQNVSGLMQIVPMAAPTQTQSTVQSYVDIPLFHGHLNPPPAIVNAHADLIVPQDNG